MSPGAGRLWRVFPWDPAAAAGERFSPEYVPPAQGRGRFDLPGVPAGVLYLAETPEHAIAEMIQHYRGQRLEEADLRAGGRGLAVVSAAPPGEVTEGVVDLCDPEALLRLGARPDETAARDRRTTQRIASAAHAAGYAGLRWWSVFFGEWHTVALFRDRRAGGLEYGTPEPLTMDHAALREAARALGVGIRAR